MALVKEYLINNKEQFYLNKELKRIIYLDQVLIDLLLNLVTMMETSIDKQVA